MFIRYAKGRRRILLTPQQFHEMFGVHFLQKLRFVSERDQKETLRSLPLCRFGWQKVPRMPDPFPVTILFYNKEIGYGLINHKPLQKNEVVGEYLGLVRPISRQFPSSTEYCLHYPTRFWSWFPRVVDAREWGNEMRFINHSSSPTLQLVRGVELGVVRHWFVAKKALDPGTLLTFDYGKDYWRRRHPPLDIR